MRETTGEYEGYTITVSNPEKIEKAKKSWLFSQMYFRYYFIKKMGVLLWIEKKLLNF